MMVEPWRVTLMGGLRAERGDHAISRFKYQKVGGLLAYLAYHRKQMHARELLVEIFWPDSDPEAGRANLSVALSSLRNQFEPPGMPAGTVLRADRYSVGVHPTALTTDAAEFQDLLQSAARLLARSSERAEQLGRAVELYQGPLLPGFYEDWIRPEQVRLSGLFFDAVNSLIALREESGDLAEALRLARHAVAVDPLREEAHQPLIRLLAAIGQPGAALRQYKELERLLEEELGAEPSAPLRALARRIEKDSGLAAPLISALPAPTIALRSDRNPSSARLPETVTFLLTDIEGATRLRERAGDAIRAALELHHRTLRALFDQHGGQELKEADDAFLIGFGSASKALACAAAAQQTLARQEWPETTGPLRVRMALYTGEVERSEDGEYYGLVLHRASRMLAAAHGGQILIGEATAGLLRAHLPAETRLVDLGVFRLRDVPTTERLYHIEYPEMPSEPFAPPAAEPGLTGHLPLVFTRFFGREAEIAALLALLAEGVRGQGSGGREEPVTTATNKVHPELQNARWQPHLLTPDPRPLTPSPRLVTLTGTGGTGKTRLAIAVAERLVEAYRGAVWFVPLADLSDPARIDDAILDTLRLPRSPQREPREQVIEFLARQPSLLILDNFEHLLTANAQGERGKEKGEREQTKIENLGGARIVQDYLARVPSLRMLVTSRQVLGLTGEREFAVAPLPTPNGPDTPERLSLFDSVQLFIDRAQQAMPHFQVSSHNAAAVAELCQRLEGIPLSLELAAARALVLTPAQMLLQLEHRFDLLAGRKRDVADRQRTLRAAIDWSYRLLTPELQRFFARLSVFRGGWSVEAAEAVCEAPLALDYLAELRECSLVLSEESGQGMRFQMLETLREYGAQRLEEQRETNFLRDRHLRFYATNLEPEPEVYGQNWLDAREKELSNSLIALAWAIEADSELGLELIWKLGGIWRRRGPVREGREWLHRLLATSAAQGRTLQRARTLSDAAKLARYDGRLLEAKALYDECLDIYLTLEVSFESCEALGGSGFLAYEMGGYEAAARIAEQWAERATKIERNLSGPLVLKAVIAGAQGDFHAASHLCRQSREEMRKDGYDENWVRVWHGLFMAKAGDLDGGRALIEDTLVLAHRNNESRDKISGLTFLSIVALLQNDRDLACRSVQEALVLSRAAGIGNSKFLTLRQAGQIEVAIGRKERAATLFSALYALSASAGQVIHPSQQKEDEALLNDLRYSLADRFDAVWEMGRAMSWEQAVEYALSLDPE